MRHLTGISLVMLLALSGSQAHADWIKGIFSPRAGIDSINRVLVIRDTFPREILGRRILNLGDINGDGAADVVVTGYDGTMSDTSRAYLYYGGKDADGLPDQLYRGLYDIALVGDINADGYEDFGMPHGPVNPPFEFQIFLGGPTFDDVPDLAVSRHWSEPFQAGDVDADGYLEIPVARYRGVEDSAKRTVDLFRIGDGKLDTIPAYSLRDTTYSFGGSMAAGDFNGDGYPDLAIGAPMSLVKGSVTFYWGGPTFDTLPDFKIATAIPQFSRIILPIGDFNGDGYEDILITGGLDTTYGIYLGGPSIHNKIDIVVNQYRGGFGNFPPTSAARAGDINHDGYPDFLLGLINPLASRYEVHVFLGGPRPAADTNIVADIYVEHRMLPCCTFYLGDQVAGIGDFTGDGIDDFAVRSQTGDGVDNWSGEVQVFAGWNSHPTDVPIIREPELPTAFTLSQNYPNPFNPETTIPFSLPQRSHVDISVYNILGQKLRTLVNTDLVSGSYKATWDGKTDKGDPAPSGVYFCKLTAANQSLQRKMMLLK